MTLLSYLFALLTMTVVAHDFHVSRLTINFDSQQGRTEMTLQTFVDDLETAVAAEHRLPSVTPAGTNVVSEGSLNLLSPKQHPLADSLVEAYVRRRVRISSGGKALEGLRYLGMEPADDPYAMYVYLSAPLPAPGATLEVDSRYFIDLYEDQQNIIVVERDGVAADYQLLTGQRTDCTFSR